MIIELVNILILLRCRSEQPPINLTVHSLPPTATQQSSRLFENSNRTKILSSGSTKDTESWTTKSLDKISDKSTTINKKCSSPRSNNQQNLINKSKATTRRKKSRKSNAGIPSISDIENKINRWFKMSGKASITRTTNFTNIFARKGNKTRIWSSQGSPLSYKVEQPVGKKQKRTKKLEENPFRTSIIAE